MVCILQYILQPACNIRQYSNSGVDEFTHYQAKNHYNIQKTDNGIYGRDISIQPMFHVLHPVPDPGSGKKRAGEVD